MGDPYPGELYGRLTSRARSPIAHPRIRESTNTIWRVDSRCAMCDAMRRVTVHGRVGSARLEKGESSTICSSSFAPCGQHVHHSVGSASIIRGESTAISLSLSHARSNDNGRPRRGNRLCGSMLTRAVHIPRICHRGCCRKPLSQGRFVPFCASCPVSRSFSVSCGHVLTSYSSLLADATVSGHCRRGSEQRHEAVCGGRSGVGSGQLVNDRRHVSFPGIRT